MLRWYIFFPWASSAAASLLKPLMGENCIDDTRSDNLIFILSFQEIYSGSCPLTAQIREILYHIWLCSTNYIFNYYCSVRNCIIVLSEMLTENALSFSPMSTSALLMSTSVLSMSTFSNILPMCIPRLRSSFSHPAALNSHFPIVMP